MMAMPKAKDFEYIVDEKGRKTKVLMSYRLFRELFEDFDDLRVKAERQHEAPEDFAKVTEELRSAGRL